MSKSTLDELIEQNKEELLRNKSFLSEIEKRVDEKHSSKLTKNKVK